MSHTSTLDCRDFVKEFLANTGEVIGDRVGTHPDPKSELEAIGHLWGSLLDIGPIPAERVALMLIVMKVVRAWERPYHYDNWVDIAGYSALGRAYLKLYKEYGHGQASVDQQVPQSAGA